jgi:archaellin
MVALLDPDLGTDQTFTLEVIPPTGAVLFIQRTTPISMEAVTSLD